MSDASRPVLKRLKDFLRPRPRAIPLRVGEVLASTEGRGLVERFNDLYYTGGVAQTLNWRGCPMIKNPCDLWMIIELFQRLRPAVLIETGTFHGGSAHFYNDIGRSLGLALRVITIDVDPRWDLAPEPEGIVPLRGSSTDEKVVARARALTEEFTRDDARPVMVTLDSDHSEAHVSRELELYAPLVSPGSYLIVEDTNVNGHPSWPDHGPGPWEAVERFLSGNPAFVVDPDCERFLLTYNPRGWLRRVS